RRGRRFDAFVTTPVTSPLRLPKDIDRCVERFDQTDADLVVCVTASDRNPYFNMVELDDEGRAQIVMSAGDSTFDRRQDAPEVFAITTVAYVAEPEYVLSTDHLYDGTVRIVEIPDRRALDIDRPFDLELARFMWKRFREEDARGESE
ncbi:MAG: acylneuraminate cytidylyltransferase family protein, partial [Bradymonadaceae bacterium]